MSKNGTPSPAQEISICVSYSNRSPGISRIRSRRLLSNARSPVCVSLIHFPHIIQKRNETARFPKSDRNGTPSSEKSLTPRMSAPGSAAADPRICSTSSGACCPSQSTQIIRLLRPPCSSTRDLVSSMRGPFPGYAHDAGQYSLPSPNTRSSVACWHPRIRHPPPEQKHRSAAAAV